MNRISLVIPTFNTSEYFLDCIKHAFKSPLIGEIVVNDDCSSQSEWNNLVSIIESLNSRKIVLSRNDANLGGFRNKFVSVQRASFEWVYLLDSDNFMTPSTLDIINSIKDPSYDVCYIPESLLLYEKKLGHTRNVNYNFGHSEINLSKARDHIKQQTEYFDWFLNTGNFVFNRQSYLQRLRAAFDNPDEPNYACSIAFSYHWLANGGSYKIVRDFKYYHRLRDDSYWITCGSNSGLSLSHYTQKFLESEL